MSFLRSSKRNPLTREASLAGRPRRLVNAKMDATASGGARLTIPMRPGAKIGWLFKLPDGAVKTFELDAIGKSVWEQCDGTSSVAQIIRRLAKQHNIGLRQAEVPTVAFLRTLARKGLIGISIESEKS